MKLAHLGVVVTTAIIAIGAILAIGPAYVHTLERDKPPPVMLSFSVVDGQNVPQWCSDLSSILAKHNVKATVFVTGKVAEESPSCVRALATYSGIDIGSQTYSYVALPSVGDYTKALDEVKRGKMAVDAAGNIDSRIFKAPYGATDQNIFSLLSSSGITADFSYPSQYNKFEGGQFVKYELVSCGGCGESPDRVRQLMDMHSPVMISIDNKAPMSEIENLVVALKNSNMNLVNASDLTGLDLTVRNA
ncbi:MAG TPA: polysaccharide deacetylase family protein [Nitrososphaera sp.]|nr:polysaccharide deacetylase family protein [Nitrososphaera sp.]